MKQFLIASDLDRTMLPNGEQPESPDARQKITELVEKPFVTLAYVSGRGKSLLQAAIKEYNVPIPDFAIGDVGTTIYEVGSSETWRPLEQWQDLIAKDWNGYNWKQMKELFDNVHEIWLQDEDPAYQSTFKVSYYTKPNIDKQALLSQLEKITAPLGIKAAFIWSVDEERNTGLLDILPQSATKLHAIQFLRKTHLNIPESKTVFAGDSGNDLPALTSGLKAVIVKNARQEVKNEARAETKKKGIEKNLYIAHGGFQGMNGNYSAGILEGVTHFLPELEPYISR